MVIYLNESGDVRTVPAALPQGSALKSVAIIAPVGAKTLVLQVTPPSGERLPDVICQPALDTERGIVYTADIPQVATHYPGRAEYRIKLCYADGRVEMSELGSFNVTRGIVTDMPDSVGELENYTLEQIYELLSNVVLFYDNVIETIERVECLEEQSGAEKLRTVKQTLSGAINELLSGNALKAGISENSVQMVGSTAGLKGFYWSKVEDDYLDNTRQIIHLSTKNGDFGTEQEFDIREFWDIGDKITVHSDQHHIDCAEISGHYNENGKWIGILVTKLPFTPTNESAHHTDQAVYVLAKPEEGLVDFGQNSVVFGEYCKALGYCNFVAGVGCEALDQYSAVFGNSNKAKYAAGAFGKENEAMGDASFVAGGKSKANGKLAIALGRHLNVEGEYNFSANSANKVYGRANAALNGSNQEFPNDNTTDGNEVYGVGNLVIGHNNSTDDNAKYCFVGGDGSSATNESSIALGYDCHATGLASQAMGYECNALGNTSHASGARSEATGSGSFAHGDGAKAIARGQAVFGNYNATNANALFQVGNGSSDTSRKNAFEVLADGSAKLGDKAVATAEDILPISTKLETVESIAKGANQAYSYLNYAALINTINRTHKDFFNVGQNIYIGTLNVPDLWISMTYSESVTYTYTNDEAIIADLKNDGRLRVGYYELSALETQKVDLTEYAKNDEIARLDERIDIITDNHDIFYEEFTAFKSGVNDAIGDIESALDEIIAIQNSLIGGETA